MLTWPESSEKGHGKTLAMAVHMMLTSLLYLLLWGRIKQRKEVITMKFMLKLFLFPFWIVAKLLSLIGNLVIHCACFVYSLLLIWLGICIVMSIVYGLWTTFFLLLGIGAGAFVVLFFISFVAMEFWVMLSDGLKKFIFS